MTLKWTLPLLALALSPSIPAFPAPSLDPNRDALLEGVTEITVEGGIPGDLAVFGDRAFPVLSGRMEGGRLPVFAAADYGQGRVVVGGHEGFFNRENLKNPDNARFALNIARWTTRRSLTGLRIGLHQQDPALRDALAAVGCRVDVLKTDALPTALGNLDLLWLDQASLDGVSNRSRVEAARRWIRKGGGLVVTGPAWGWQSINSSLDLGRDQSGNRLVIPMGIAFSGGMLESTGRKGFLAEDAGLELTRADQALNALDADTSGRRSLSKEELRQVSLTLGQAIAVLPESSNGFLQQIKALCASHGGDRIPTRQTPITTDMPFARLQAVLDMKAYRSLPPEKVKPHPSAASFPGSIPGDAPRINRQFTLDTRIPGWHGTGLYAAPGEVVTVTVPRNAAGQGLAIRIGAHTDTLWDLDRWERFPEVTLTRPLDRPTVRIASPFGGTLYLVVPEGCKLDDVPVTLSHAVAAPRYVRGRTTPQDWKTLRNAPGPWAELEGNLVILTVPSSSVRDLEDPDSLMAYWDEVMERCYELFAAPRRIRPERYCVDRQISAGYMHSGYPVMTGDDVARTFCDVRLLRSKNGPVWGFYHEMGHNFQQPDWTWADWGEVSNNLFSLFGSETINDTPIGAHPAMTEVEIQKRMRVVASAPGRERYYARDPWYPLTMLFLIKQAFGWDPFTRVFAEFRDLPEGRHPKTEAEKHDQFLIRFSRATGHDLTGYLTDWGVETSETARREVAGLPPWMPKDWPIENVKIVDPMRR